MGTPAYPPDGALQHETATSGRAASGAAQRIFRKPRLTVLEHPPAAPLVQDATAFK